MQTVVGPKACLPSNPCIAKRNQASKFNKEIEITRLLLEHVPVQAIIRLNDSSYDPAPLRAAGVAVADMPFPEAAAPPAAVVGK